MKFVLQINYNQEHYNSMVFYAIIISIENCITILK